MYLNISNADYFGRSVPALYRISGHGWISTSSYLFIFAVIYGIAVYLGNELYYRPQFVATLWPASGMFMGALLVVELRAWPAVILTATLSQMGVDLLVYDKTFINALLFGINNTIEPIVGACLLMRFCNGIPKLSRLSHIMLLTVVGALISTLFSAIGGAGLVVFYTGLEYWSIFRVWWFADALGVLVTLPVILAFYEDGVRIDTHAISRMLESIITFGCILGLTQYIFGSSPGQYLFVLDFPYLIFPVLLWLIVRFDKRMITASLLCIAILITLNTDLGYGPFISDEKQAHEIIISVQAFTTTLALSILLFFAVISERKLALIKLSENERELADTVTRLEQEMTVNEKVSTELESRNAELERFSYTVSHELKSPLVTIKGFVGLLDKDVASGDWECVTSDLERISSATDTMDALLSELLELSRIGQVAGEPVSCNLSEIAKKASERAGLNVKDKAIRIDIEDMPNVEADENRLLEVYLNLIENGVKFMGDQKSPQLKIGAAEKDGMICCFVQDNGLGIAAEHTELIFGLFERLNANTEGTGVGLTLVKRIIEVHGGKIWVESEGLGQGCKFSFTLPIKSIKNSESIH